MMLEQPTIRRNLFEIENAKNLSRDELVQTFVPTQAFFRLLTPKNHIVLGSRGSGKTALVKMLGHDHLSRLQHDSTRTLIDSKLFIGIYVPMNVTWVGALKNKRWQNEQEAEEFFQWRLNISTCLALLTTMRSCLDTYIEDDGDRSRMEMTVVRELANSWSDGDRVIDSIRGLQNYLEDIEHKKQQQLVRLRVTGRLRDGEELVGIPFDTDLFVPLRRGIALINRALDFPPETTWALALDEAEFLDPIHHRILNSYLRTDSGSLVFNIATMPYYHHTLETNTSVPLNVGHDFEYVYIDQDPVLKHHRGHTKEDFAHALYRKRARLSTVQKLTLYELFGPSVLLDRANRDWGPKSKNMQLLQAYSTPQTLERAQRLLATDKAGFQDQIGRKMQGMLLLRSKIEEEKGHHIADVYSGVSMVIRCSDLNPRRLIRILNELLSDVGMRKVPRGSIALSPKVQSRILVTFSTSLFQRVQSEPEVGPQLYDFLDSVGSYMRRSLHMEPLATDHISSFQVDRGIPDIVWRLVKRAVAVGLLYPNINTSNPDHMPEWEGTFHLAYALAPHFRLLPRRGRARALSSMLDVRTLVPTGSVYQTGLFDE